MTDRPQITRWIIPTTGLNQNPRRPSGIERWWGVARSASTPTTCVMRPLEWDSDWEAIAQFIARNSASHEAVVDQVAFSWGAGWGAMQLAHELARLPVPMSIRRAVLADPVYRSKHLPFMWRSMLNRVWAPEIVVPGNIKEVHWTRQRNNKPQGHDLRRANGLFTGIRAPIVRDLNHDQMDDDPEFHRLALEVLGIEQEVA